MRKFFTIIFLVISMEVASQNSNYIVGLKYNISRALISYTPSNNSKIPNISIVEPLSSSAELLIGYSISDKFIISAVVGFQQWKLGYYDVPTNPIISSAGVSGGSGAPIGYLETYGLSISSKILTLQKFSLEGFVQPFIGLPKYSQDYLDTSSNRYFWSNPDEYTLKIKYPPYLNKKTNKLLRCGMDINYSKNNRVVYSLGCSYQFGNNVFLRDLTSIEIPSKNLKEMHTASINGKAIIFSFSIRYKFNISRRNY